MVKGSSAALSCQVAGTGPFVTQWFKDTKELKPSTKHSFSQTIDTVLLEVCRFEAVDVGEYQCTVANEVGSCTCKASLSFKGLFDWSGLLIFIYFIFFKNIFFLAPSRRVNNLPGLF